MVRALLTSTSMNQHMDSSTCNHIPRSPSARPVLLKRYDVDSDLVIFDYRAQAVEITYPVHWIRLLRGTVPLNQLFLNVPGFGYRQLPVISNGWDLGWYAYSEFMLVSKDFC